MTTRFLLFATLLLMAACNLFNTPSKVRSGQLYEPGVPDYDAYFKDVHLLQVEANGWDDDKKTSRRPLVDALKLGDTAADVSISQATHEKMVSLIRVVGPAKLEVKNDEPHVVPANDAHIDDPVRDLFHAIEAVAKSEIERSKALRLLPARVDGLTKTGRSLQPRVQADFGPHGGSAAGDAKQELTVSFDVLQTISTNARNAAREADDFVADLQRAVSTTAAEGNGDAPAVKAPATKHVPPSHVAPTTPPASKPPPPKPAAKPAGEEDFNP